MGFVQAPNRRRAFVAHRSARLTVSGRLLLVERIEVEGWSVAQAATAQGISRTTAYKWWARWRAEGPAGLLDRSSAPQRRPRALAAGLVEAIVSVRRRLGLNRLSDLDRTTRRPMRYVRDHPGDLVHLDIKPLGRIPPGGGKRLDPRWPATKTG